MISFFSIHRCCLVWQLALNQAFQWAETKRCYKFRAVSLGYTDVSRSKLVMNSEFLLNFISFLIFSIIEFPLHCKVSFQPQPRPNSVTSVAPMSKRLSVSDWLQLASYICNIRYCCAEFYSVITVLWHSAYMLLRYRLSFHYIPKRSSNVHVLFQTAG